MKIAVLGDIHANLEALTVVLDKCRELKVDKYACIGDIVGYNANPRECLQMVRELDLLAIVMGNHDSYTSNNRDLIGFNPQAAAAVQWTRQQLSEEELQWLSELPLKQDVFLTSPMAARFSIVHATMDNPHMWGYIFDRYAAVASMQYQWMPICFFGHTHMPMVFEKFGNDVAGTLYDKFQIQPNKKYLVNVGSVGQPRDRDPRASFAVYDVNEGTVELIRIEYDIEKARQKILDAGLPPRCADRLQVGQ